MDNSGWWYRTTAEETLAALGASVEGLSAEEVRKRLEQHGKNVLPEAKRDGLVLMFARQFQSPLIYVLVVAAGLIAFIGDTTDAVIILAVLLFNAIIGTVQEGRAQNTLDALKHFVETKATVLRNGIEEVVADADVVPGDVLVLSEGERVPADARVLVSNSLRLDEAALTGESTPVAKSIGTIGGENLPAAEQKNMTFRGTYVVAGNGRAVVTATGTNTVIGGIAQNIAAVDTEIPLKKDIRDLSRLLVLVAVGLVVLLFGWGMAAGHSAEEMFATVVALSVSIIPEGLPVVITLVLAAGVWRMSKRNALVKKLQAVEALGQARIIAVDKTGTITKNELVVERVFTAGKEFMVSGVGYEPKGGFMFSGVVVEPANHEELMFMGKIATFCASARVLYSEAEKRYRVSGDPTEAAMLVLGQKLGYHKDVVEEEMPMISELPFDYRAKFHATLHKSKKDNFLTVVGAPEVVLARSAKLWDGSKNAALTDAKREELEEKILELSSKGLRVVGVAHNKAVAEDTLDADNLPELSFVGLLCMKDALRQEVAESVLLARSAGVKVVMITGDHKATARALAKEAGIYHDGDTVLSGAEVEEMDDATLAARLQGVSVFARVTPEHKLRIIKAYKARGEVVAMTGDGVNDAPSLVAADLGVAMGGIGTEVAKEASDIVLLDDNLRSIVAAIEEGRNMYRSIKKVVLYLLSCGVGETFTIMAALVAGLPLPLLPAQIIWLNFVTDPFLDVALGTEPKEKGLLNGRAQRNTHYLIDGRMVRRMATFALPMVIGSLALFAYYAESDLPKALTMSFAVLAVFQWFTAWCCRSETRSVFADNPFKTPYLLGATALVVSLQMLAIYTPFMQGVLNTVPLTLADWLVVLPVAFSVVVVDEMRKYFRRRAGKRADVGLETPSPRAA